jgi:hypothetical protein
MCAGGQENHFQGIAVLGPRLTQTLRDLALRLIKLEQRNLERSQIHSPCTRTWPEAESRACVVDEGHDGKDG